MNNDNTKIEAKTGLRTKTKTKTVGIIGGMGPMATYDLARKITENTLAECDQDHLRVILDCNTSIPDRTAAIMGQGESPVPALTASAKILETAGADFLIMPCNTAHYFLDYVKKAVSIPFISMPEVVADKLKDESVSKALLLATDGTIDSGVYDQALEQVRVETLHPNKEGQALVMSLIYDHVKAGDLNLQSRAAELNDMINAALEEGAQKILLACTELPIAFDHLDELKAHYQDKLIDPTLELARAAIVYAGASLV